MDLKILFVTIASLLVVIGSANADNCPDLFKRYSKNHSYCLAPNSSCEILAYYPTDEDIQYILNLHNMYRSSIAIGKESLPAAANMLQMDWDNELAAVAQKYADQCLYKHDCSNCRRVRNFGVGQNLAIQRVTGGHTVPQPDWRFAISNWFSEILYFNEDTNCPFKPPVSESKEYRHFSQLIWAKSYRVGCGYVLYKNGKIFTNETFTRLYVCDYGVAGNVYGSCVYETGKACSNCPKNSCCGSSCGYGNNYDGLCKLTDGNGPNYPPTVPQLFHCKFETNNLDCNNYIEGDPNWLIDSTLSGNYVESVLNGGAQSNLIFSKSITPNVASFCVTIRYRKGPTIDGNEAANNASIVFSIPSNNYTTSMSFPSYDNPARQQFSTYNITLGWQDTTTMKLFFSVPPGKPPQFLDVAQLSAVDGDCQ